jgi:hypothetical protein
MKKLWFPLLFLACIFSAGAQSSIPAVLSDKIHRGSGVIDILRNVKAADFASYLNENGSLFLGVDINESSSAPETSRSQGVAIQDMRLLLTTTAGDFSFGDFYTSTTAMIRARGSDTPQEFSTLFGQTGSNQLTSSTSGFNLSPYDDVITFNNIAFTGEILSARLDVKFLETETGKNAGVNELFFNFSGGFEDFAILTQKDATILEQAGIGQAAAPDGLTFQTVETPLSPSFGGGGATDGGTGGTGGTDPSAPGGDGGSGGATNPGSTAPGAPAPPLLLLIFGTLLMGIYQWNNRRQSAEGAT